LPESVVKLPPQRLLTLIKSPWIRTKKQLRFLAAIKQKTHRPATLAVGRNPRKLNGELVGQPPRARQGTRATRTAAAYRVHLEIEVHPTQNTRLRLTPASLARNENKAGVVVQLRLWSDLSNCTVISAGERCGCMASATSSHSDTSFSHLRPIPIRK